MRRDSGFTILELLTAFVLVCIVGTLVLVQKNDIDTSSRDQQRKTALNSMYYGLKEAYFKEKGSYPTTIDATILPYVDPALFETIGEDAYKVHYIGQDCEQDVCKGFQLRVKLEKEAEYKRSS